eukprot:6239545-Pyramimonas_sp.AAC.1
MLWMILKRPKMLKNNAYPIIPTHTSDTRRFGQAQQVLKLDGQMKLAQLRAERVGERVTRPRREEHNRFSIITQRGRRHRMDLEDAREHRDEHHSERKCCSRKSQAKLTGDADTEPELREGLRPRATVSLRAYEGPEIFHAVDNLKQPAVPLQNSNRVAHQT